MFQNKFLYLVTKEAAKVGFDSASIEILKKISEDEYSGIRVAFLNGNQTPEHLREFSKNNENMTLIAADVTQGPMIDEANKNDITIIDAALGPKLVYCWTGGYTKI